MDVLVVGGGAAGIFAALSAAQQGAHVVLLEKTIRLGTKILVSGGGKCNVTHAGPIEDVLRAFRPNEARFLRPSAYRFDNTQVVELFAEHGLELYERPDGRLFPVDKNAKDVVAILRQMLDEAGVEVRFQTPCRAIVAQDGAVVGVRTPSEVLPTSRVVVAVGGSSYPNSGTSGDGWPWMAALGHTVVPVRAALAPMDLAWTEERFDGLAGVALRDVLLIARFRGKIAARWRGDVLFTHQGVSGPCALGISREVAECLEEGPAELEADLVPDRPFEDVTQTLSHEASTHPHRRLATLVEAFLPERAIPVFLSGCRADPETPGSRLDKKTRTRVANALKAWPLGPVTHVPLEKGEVVAGGVSLDEVDPHTMESRRVRGLFLCGEVLDIAGPVGGYNLQAAWSTGWAAGKHAAS